MSSSRLALVLFTPLLMLLAACGGSTLPQVPESDSTPSRPPLGGGTPLQLVASQATRRPAEPDAVAPIRAATTAFAADLYEILARTDGNLVFSPYSAAVALSMTRAGADGLTADEMDAVLRTNLAGDLHAGFNALDQALARRPGERTRRDGTTATVELATANQLWGQHGFSFLSPFLDTLAADYGAGLRLVDYENDAEGARELINGWVAERTRERIPELIGSGVLDESTRLVLTNAIYLKAPWEFPFWEPATADAAFHRLDGSVVTAQLMRLAESIPYYAGDDYQAVELPYAGSELSMILLVPDAGRFQAVEGRLEGLLSEKSPRLQASRVRLRMPTFEYRTQASLSSALAELGMGTAFTRAADFSGMTDEQDLRIDQVIHEAFIAVDEEGTEAAAATAEVMSLESALPIEPIEWIELTIDRPFIFAIRDTETGAVLFLGRVVDPTA